MEKEFIPYEQALALKELGFDEPCFGEYRQWDGNEPWLQLYQDLDGCSTDPADYEYTVEAKAPTFSQAFRWFREKHQMVFCYEPCLKKDLTYIFFIYVEVTGEKVFVVESKYNEEAELACLKRLIEICKNK